jgi:hypothetical protein
MLPFFIPRRLKSTQIEYSLPNDGLRIIIKGMDIEAGRIIFYCRKRFAFHEYGGNEEAA